MRRIFRWWRVLLRRDPLHWPLELAGVGFLAAAAAQVATPWAFVVTGVYLVVIANNRE